MAYHQDLTQLVHEKKKKESHAQAWKTTQESAKMTKKQN